MYHLTEAYLMMLLLTLLSAYLGALIFAAAVVAPAAIRLLSVENAARLLRAFWATYHRFAVIGALTLTAIGTLAAPFSALPAIYAVLLTSLGALMTLCFFTGLQLIPRINQASDDQDLARFQTLHRLDIILVATGMVIGLLLVIALGYVLPGHFTFWQH